MSTPDTLVDNHQDNDGIQEYDNPLPNWFLYMFLGSIVFACLYMAYYTGHGWSVSRTAGVGLNLPTSGAAYLLAVKRSEEALGKTPAAEPVGEALLAVLKAPASISKGETVYRANCAACHGDQGQGIVGPNLTDKFWIHGGRPEAILASISEGFPDKGMPSWKPTLGGEKVRLATAYVMSLKGKPVTNPKAPQGVEEP
jgi:cytochrome c oxidase cbb3-type subunit 3